MPVRHSAIHKVDKKPDCTPQIIAQYRDSRTAKVRANREISLLSHI